MPYTLTVTGDHHDQFLRELAELGAYAGVAMQVRENARNMAREKAAKDMLPISTDGAKAELDFSVTMDGAQPAPEAPAEEKPKAARVGRPRKIVDTGSGGVPMPPEPLADKPLPADPLEVPDFLQKPKPVSDKVGILYPVPKNLDELRAMLNEVIAKKGPAVVDDIVIKKLGAAKLKLVTPEQFDEAGKLIAEALAA